MNPDKEEKPSPTISPELKTVFDHAVNEARSLGHEWVGTPHLLLGLMQNPNIVEIMKKLRLNPDLNIARSITFTYGLMERKRSSKVLSLTDRAKSVVTCAGSAALKKGSLSILPKHLLYGMTIVGGGMIEEILRALRTKQELE